MRKDFSRRIRRLRQALRLTQHDLAARLRVQTQVVASWEQGRKKPSPSSFGHLAKLAPPKDAWFFLNQMGITKQLVREKWPKRRTGPRSKESSSTTPGARLRAGEDPLRSQVRIPLLREEAVKDPLAITKRDIQSFLTVPPNLLPKESGSYVAIPVHGDSMAPLLRDGFLVVLDPATRDPVRLGGQMVAVQGPEGVLVRWLQVESRSDRLVLRAENPAYPELVLRNPPASRILGAVVSWWGRRL